MTLQNRHLLLIEAFRACGTAEERLEWLLERTPIGKPLERNEVDDGCRVRECVSPLWFRAAYEGGLCSFRARSESRVVGGVVTFVCDLYSGLLPDHVCSLGRSTVQDLGLETLLGINRRLTVERVVYEILAAAKGFEVQTHERDG